MDQELKQRLIGAIVVTALATIFIPMLFDDPVDQSGQAVSELVIPESPVKTSEDAANKLPANAGDVLAQPEHGLTPEETEATFDEPLDTNVQQDTEVGYADGAPDAEEGPVIDEPDIDEPVITPPTTSPKPKHVVDGQAAHVPVAKTKPAAKQAPVAKVETPVAKPKPKPVAKPVQPNVSAAKAKPAPSLSRWYIQVGSYGQEANAMAMWNKLRKQGFPVLMETVHLPEKGTLYRLKVGPELDHKRASAMKAKLEKQNNLKTLLRAE